MRTRARPNPPQGSESRLCPRCSRPLPAAMRQDSGFCSSACRQAAYRRRIAESRNATSGSRNGQIPGQLSLSQVLALMEADK
jgi:hypothetical protein